MSDQPFACALAPEQASHRGAALAQLARHALIAAELTAGTGRITLRHDERSALALEEFVRAERECCPFFDLRVMTEPDVLVLEVGGPEGAEPMVAALVEEFSARR